MIRQAMEKDLQAIADVHMKCFPDSFSTRLGEKHEGYLLTRFYSEYMLTVPELFLVAENDNNEIVGFCMGYYCEKNDYIKKYFKNNLGKIGLRIVQLLITGNSQAWRKVKDRFTKKNPFVTLDDSYENIEIEKRGDLLSICVLSECRGNGMAQKLIEEFQYVLKKHGRAMCVLTVKVSNGRGIEFYERNKFCAYKEVNGVARTYVKLLS